MASATAASAHPRARAAAAACPGETLVPTVADAPFVDAATLCLIDRIRAAYGLRALHPNRYLHLVAASQVATMVRWDYFADDRPSGQTPLSLVRITRYTARSAGVAVGQNIAWGTGSLSSPRSIVAQWMASPPHRAVILTPGYRDAGIAAAPAVPGSLARGRSGATYAMEFAVRRG